MSDNGDTPVDAPRVEEPRKIVTPKEIEDAWKAAEARGKAAADAGIAAAAAAKARREGLPTEIEQLKARLETATARLAKMEEIVNRYASVQEPVVASDGFTYSRGAIEAYVGECRSKGLPAVSHQTKQELKPHFTDNRSLVKLVDTLKPLVAPVKPEDAVTSSPPPPPQVAPIG